MDTRWKVEVEVTRTYKRSESIEFISVEKRKKEKKTSKLLWETMLKYWYKINLKQNMCKKNVCFLLKSFYFLLNSPRCSSTWSVRNGQFKRFAPFFCSGNIDQMSLWFVLLAIIPVKPALEKQAEESRKSFTMDFYHLLPKVVGKVVYFVVLL